MTGTVSLGEVEGWLHAMTMGPLPQDVVARVLDDYQRVQRKQAERQGDAGPAGAGVG